MDVVRVSISLAFITCFSEKRIFTILYCNTNSYGFKSTTSKFLLLIPVSIQICPLLSWKKSPLTFLKINMLLKISYLLASPKWAVV